MADDQLIEVYRGQNEPQAQLVQDMLEEAGINSRLVGQYLQGAVGELPVGEASAPGVWVFEREAAAARKLIDEMEAKASVYRVPAWNCPRCDTEVEAGIDMCWKCLYNPHAC